MSIDMHALLKTTAIAVIFVASITISFAGIYTWTDENGKKHYSDKKPAENTEVTEIATPKQRSPSNVADKKKPNQSADNGLKCSNKRSACESQWRQDYSYRLSLCKGDWSAAAAIGNSMYGGNRTGGSMAQACKTEARDNRDNKLKTCSRTYQMCLKN